VNHHALIAIAPLLDAKRFGNPEWERPGRDSYWGNSLKLLPGEVALLVDHDDERQIGVVRALYELAWTDGRWVVADAVVTDPPSWLRKGTPASLSRYNTHVTRSAEGAERVTSAFVNEVSVLPPGVKPAEPRAQVVHLEAEPIAHRHQPEPEGEVIYGNGQLIRRYYDNVKITIR